MESVIFDGKEYIKASVLAERFNYTQDYLGQLCRGKKVDARLVGRAWYLNLDSLHNHRKGRYKTDSSGQLPKAETDTATVSLNQPKPHFLTRVDVEPVLKKKTVKILKNKDGKLREFPVKYETDDYSLIPKISREAISKSVPILPANAEDVSINVPKEAVKVTAFKAEPLPEVYLKGKLKVAGIPEITEEDTQLLNHDPEEHKDKITNQENKIFPQTQLDKKSEGISERKPLKIKLYRMSPHERPDKNLIQHSQPNIKAKPGVVVAKRTLPKLSATGPGENILKSQPAKTGNIAVRDVKKTPINASRAQAVPQSVMAAERVVPFATTKALLVFTLSVFLAVSVFLLQTETYIQGKDSSQKWSFSTQQVSSLLAVLIAEKL